MVEQQTKIAHLLQMPVGQGTGGYMLYVKTFKKRWQASNNAWYQQCICADDTGEILTEVRIGSNHKLSKEIRVVVGEIRETDWLNKPRKCLFVLEYTEPTQTPDEWMEQADKVFAGEMNEIKGKCRYGISCAFIRTGFFNDEEQKELLCPDGGDREAINRWVEFIMTGK